MNNSYTSRPGAWAAFIVVSLFFMFEFVARIEPSLASSEIMNWFELSGGGFGVLSSIFFWIYAPMQLVVGLLLDRYGPRRFVGPAILIMSLGVMLFAVSNNLILAGIGRFLTGLGASFAFVSGLYVVNHWFLPSRFAVLSGTISALGMVGTAISSVALTSLVAETGWRSVYLGTGAAGLLLFIASATFFRSSETPSVKTEPLIAPLWIVVSNRRIWWIALLGSLYYMPVNVFGGLWGKAELTADHGLSAIKAGTAISMIFWGMAVGSVGAGWISDRIGNRKWIIVSNSTLAGLSYSIAIFANSQSAPFISIMLFLGGLFGGAQILTFALAKEGLPKANSGTVIAFVNMIGIGGALIFQPLIGTVIDMSDGAFGPALLTIPLCLGLSAMMAAFLTEHRHPDHGDKQSYPVST